jgi:hypothetical protein
MITLANEDHGTQTLGEVAGSELYNQESSFVICDLIESVLTIYTARERFSNECFSTCSTY